MAIRRMDFREGKAQPVGTGRLSGECRIMASIVIECPKTNREFSTGIIIDQASFEVLRNVPARARCPHCGQEHEWRKRDVRLVEAIPAAEWIENQKQHHA
jgi:hypothetical protein